MKNSLLIFIFCLNQFLNINVDNDNYFEFRENFYDINYYNNNDNDINNDDSSEVEKKGKILIKESINYIFGNLNLSNDSNTFEKDKLINAGLNLIKLNVEPQCIEFLVNISSGQQKLGFFSEAIFDSGLSSDDMGIEDYCIETKDWYYGFTIFQVNDKDININNELVNKIIEFLEIKRIGKSFCLWKNCISLYPYLLNHSTNTFENNSETKEKIYENINLLLDITNNSHIIIDNITLNDTLYKLTKTNFKYEFNLTMISKIIGMSGIKLFNQNYIDDTTKKKVLNYEENDKYKSSIDKLSTLNTILSIYIIIRLIFSIIFVKINSSSEDENTIDQEELMKQIQRSQSNFTYNKEEKSFEEDRHYLTKKKGINESFSYKFFSSLSLFYNFSNINEDKNLIYNEKNLNVISGIKVFLLFFMFLAQNSFMIIKTATQYTLFKTFFSNFSFFVIKIGILAIENYKIISGCLFGYKFLTYYHYHRNLTFSEIIKFYIKCIPYIFSFFLIFTLLQNNLLYIGLAVKNSIHFEFIGDTYFNYECTKKAFSILNPLNLYKSNYTCNTFAFYLVSEFYSYTILFILVIICLKLKKAIIEYIYFLFFGFMAIFLFLFVYPIINNDIFKISEIFGNIYLTRYPHVFLLFYFIGFNIGIMYYYYINYSETYNEYNEKIINAKNDIYMPFFLDYKIMLYFSQKKGKIKNIILIISIVLYILVSLDFGLLILIYYDRMNQPQKFLICKDFFINFIYIYDGLISSIIFSIILLMILLRNEYSLLNKIIGSKFFRVFDRISYTFLSTSNFVIGYFHCSNYIDIYLNVRNVLSTTIPLFVSNFILSIVLIILIEIPIKYLIRAITGKSLLNK